MKLQIPDICSAHSVVGMHITVVFVILEHSGGC